MIGSEQECSSSGALEKAEGAVNELYEYRDTYVDVHGVEACVRKKDDVEGKLKGVLAQLDHLQLSIDNKAVFFYLRGKALNVTAEFDQHAEECLSKAVKLDPNLIEAWNQLGESYWKNRNIDAAANCFKGAITKSKNKVSLRNLSMVQRQLGADHEEKVNNIRLSVDTAKEAVALDVTDGQSWFVLGNAFLSVFFFAGQKPGVLKQCMSAYTRAEADRMSANNPDLHYNRAVAYKYQEDYVKALGGYTRAALLDPGWKEPVEERETLLQRLRLCDDLVKNKGHLKPKKLKNMTNQIKDSDLGPFLGGSYTSPLNKTITLKCALIKDLRTERNDNIVIYGKVLSIVPVPNGVPFQFVLVDASGRCIVVSVFNLAVGKGMIVGDSVAIPEPFVQHHELKIGSGNKAETDASETENGCGEEKEETAVVFDSIRVDNPVVLVVNKRKVGLERLSFSVLHVTNKSE